MFPCFMNKNISNKTLDPTDRRFRRAFVGGRERKRGENLLPPMTKPIVPANHGFLNGSRRTPRSK